MEDAIGVAGLALYVLIIGFFIAVGWKIYQKAGRPGWVVLVPIYNLYVLMKVVGRPAWWLVLFLLPVVNLVIAIIVNIDLAKSFGKDLLYGLGITFLGFIFLPMLAFGSATYKGPAASESATSESTTQSATQSQQSDW